MEQKNKSESNSIKDDEKYIQSSLEVLGINSEIDKVKDITLIEKQVWTKDVSLLDKEESEIIIKEDNSNSTLDSENIQNKNEFESMKQEDEEENSKKKEVKKRKDPAAIPKKGYFFEHDDREREKNDVKNLSSFEIDSKKTNKNKVKKNRKKNKKLTNEIIENDNPWLHDRFDLNEQKPKTRDELIKKYGFDIRESEQIQFSDLKNEKYKLTYNSNITNRKITQNHTDNNNRAQTNLINKRFQNNQEENYDDELIENEQRNILIKQNNGNQDFKISHLRRKKIVNKQTSLNFTNEIGNNYNGSNVINQNKFQNYKNSTQNSQQKHVENVSSENINKTNNNFSKQDARSTNSFDDNDNFKSNNNYLKNDHLNSEVPKRYSSIRNQTQNKHNFLFSNSINQQPNLPNLEQTNNYEQFLFHNHSSFQHHQNWQNSNTPIMNHHNLQAIHSNVTMNNSTSSPSQHQMTLINNQLYYMQQNEYTQLSEYGPVAILNPIYFANSHQQNDTFSPISQVVRQSKAIPIVDPQQIQRNLN